MRPVQCIIILAALLALSGSVVAGTLDHNFDQGNQLYIEGDYAAAIAEYEKILNAGFASSALHYNLGNAYFRSGKLGLAIANYLRAQRLDPRDGDILANLEFARQFTIDKIEISEETILLDYINRFFNSFSVDEITMVTFILYILIVAAVVVRFVYRRIYVYSPIIIALIFLLSMSAIFMAAKLDRDVLAQTGVVLEQQAEVKNGPGDDFSDQFTAHAGLTFKIEREESGYYLVNFENRLKGWIKREFVEKI